MSIRTLILGTDWWSDCDDCVAMRILSRAVKAGKVKLAGVGINGCMEYSVASVDGFLQKEGLKDIPLGIDLAATGYQGATVYQERLSQYAVNYKKNEDAEDGIRLYRRLLKEAEGKVEIMEIGFLQILSGLLLSGADDISEKTGMELVKEKVEKVWIMAGNWAEEGGMEHNFCLNEHTRMAGHILCEKCPVPVTFLGWEIGWDVITGVEPGDDVLYQAMNDHGSCKGRSSWDPMLVLMAINGDEAASGYDVVCGTASLDAETGKNYFTESADGLHKYVVRKYEPAYYAEKINELIR